MIEAPSLARTLLHERLAACADIGAGISRLSWWKCAIEAAEEVPPLLQTRATMFGQLSGCVKALHPYETPSTIATELADVEPAYAAWLQAQTG